MLTIFLLFVAFSLRTIYSALYTCSYLQYKTEEVALIDHCISSSVNGSISSQIISCDESGKAPIFTEWTYKHSKCIGNPISTQQISTPIISYNCNGNDCALIFRLYDTMQGVDATHTCNRATDFADIAVIRGFPYIINGFLSNSCTEYDCIEDQNKVMIKDCLSFTKDIIYTNIGDCEAMNNTYFDGLIHCGPFSSHDELIPKVPTRFPSESPVTKLPSLTPTDFPSRSRNDNSTLEPTDYVKMSTESSAIETDNIENENIYGSDTHVNDGKIFILPAIPAQVIAFLITLFLFGYSIYYLFINVKTSNKIEIYMKPLVVFIFVFNLFSILLQIAICSMMQLFVYNIKTQWYIYVIYYVALICYVLGKCCLQLFFILRVYRAFRNKIYGLSEIHLYILSIWMSVVSISWLILMLSDNRYWVYSNYLYIVVTVLDISLTGTVLFLFIKRLQDAIIAEASIMRSPTSNTKMTPFPLDSMQSSEVKIENAYPNTVDDLKKENEKRLWPVCCKYNIKEIKSVKKDLKSNVSVIFLMTKLILLSGISLITTTVFGIYLSYEIFVKQTFIVFALWAVDICINSACLFLNFGFSNNVYKICCNVVHNACQKMMENIFVSKIIDEQQNE